MLYYFLEILYPRKEKPLPDVELYKRSVKVGFALVVFFLLTTIFYKLIIPQSWVFLISLLFSCVGVPMFLISAMNLLYVKMGWELSQGRTDCNSISKFINFFGSALLMILGIFLPIFLKL